jgi:hypothetical protein
MTRAADLKRMLDPARAKGESQAVYHRRRALAATAVAQTLKGRLAVAGVDYGMVPPDGTDPEVDARILRGDLRLVGHRNMLYECVRIDKPDMPVEIATRRMRVVRTKGVPYVKGKP